jgi:hypothetical protein
VEEKAEAEQRHIVDLDIHRRRSNISILELRLGYVTISRHKSPIQPLLHFVHSSPLFDLSSSPIPLTRIDLLAKQSLRTESSHILASPGAAREYGHLL